ncbi:MAG: hypothetical protein GF355_08080, partial [Candidatus Eisenbacteria bacterium]|nr:hypothetical protein [Candidatus Eisenbacteria bacterium]
MRQWIMRGACGLAMALLVLSGGVAAVHAMNPVNQNDVYEIPLKSYDLHNYSSTVVEQAKQEASTNVARRYGGNWRVYSWNPQTGTPAYLIGSGVDLVSAAALAVDPEAAGRQVMRENSGALGVNPDQLVLDDVTHGLGKTAVHFSQVYQGVPVHEGRAHATFTDEGRLFVLSSNYHGNIELDTNPYLTASEAEELARLDLPFDRSTDSIEDGTSLLILPVPVSETDVSYHLVWRVRVHTEEPLGIWVTHVDAHSGGILWRYNDVHFVDFSGDANSDVQPDTYCNGVENQAAAHLRIQVSGVGNTNTDADGNWTLGYGGSDPKTVTADLYGPYVDINNYGGAEAEFSGTATPGVPFTVSFDDGNAQHDERDVFDAVNDIHEYFLHFDPGFGYINQRITAYVSRNSTCNAYWNGTINFYREGGGCANTGEIQGVVHHEFGHGIQDHILGQQGNQGLGEGNSDVMANLITRESIIGRGFYLNQCTSGIRDSDNNLQYPEDVIGQPIHSAGRVIAGFHWDSMMGLWDLYGEDQGTIKNGELWHFARVLEHPLYQPDQVLATFIADDDDGNLDNGTPHYDQLCIGATNHGFDCPEILEGVIITHIPPPSPVDEGDLILTAEIYSTLAQMDPDSVLVIYRENGGDFMEMPMTETDEDQYAATFENLTAPKIVDYYIHAVDELGNFRNSPPLAPDDLHGFVVPSEYDDIEEDTGWTVNAEGGDDATTGEWERVDPVPTIAQPDDDHTLDPGHICWITGQHVSGQSDG